MFARETEKQRKSRLRWKAFQYKIAILASAFFVIPATVTRITYLCVSTLNTGIFRADAISQSIYTVFVVRFKFNYIRDQFTIRRQSALHFENLPFTLLNLFGSIRMPFKGNVYKKKSYGDSLYFCCLAVETWYLYLVLFLSFYYILPIFR